MSHRLVLALAGCALAVAAPRAAAQTYVVDPGTPFTASAVTDAVLGSQMTGMLVTVRYSDGTSYSGSWGFLFESMGAQYYGYRTDLFTVAMQGDQDTGGPAINANDVFMSNVNPSEASIVGLQLQGAPGNVLFDRSFGGAIGTPGSGAGRDVRKADPDEDDDEFLLTVTYRDEVSLAGAPPVGDLFATVDIAIGNPLPQGETYSFFLDTDVARSLTTVPEPATAALVGAGLAALAVVARRRGTASTRRGLD